MPLHLDESSRQTTRPRPGPSTRPAPAAATSAVPLTPAIPTTQELRDRVAELEATVDQLTGALRNRPPVEHVVGMLMVTGPTDAETAWAVLSKVSQDTNCRVRDLVTVIAADVAHGFGLPPRVLRTLRDLTSAVARD